MSDNEKAKLPELNDIYKSEQAYAVTLESGTQESPALALLKRSVEILHVNATWSNSSAELADEIADFLNGKLVQESPADAWRRGVMETFREIGFGEVEPSEYIPPASTEK